MKKLLVIFALAAAFVLSFSAIAGAEYAGANLIGGNPARPGYLTWDQALTIMQKTQQDSWDNDTQGIPYPINTGAMGALDGPVNNPHGGYATTTTKCAVCHSVHRAIAINADGSSFEGTGLSYNACLTGEVSTCENCHATTGGGAASSLVEWPDENDAQAATNPSAHTLAAGGGSCIMCHQGRIHGGEGSQYWGMNAYMLGNPGSQDKWSWDGNTPTDDYQGYETADARIDGEMAANASTKGITDVFYTTVDSPDYNNYGIPTNSWSLATDVNGIQDPDGIGHVTPAQMAAIKANAAGYTCARTGCHQNSMFSVNQWGFSAPRDNNGLGASLTDASDLVSITGHRTLPGASADATLSFGQAGGSMCGPCHPGNYSGGFRAYGAGGLLAPADSAAVHSTAYGCDQCHDMVGVATGTTAWPHANGQISVYEWANSADDPDAYTTIGYRPETVNDTVADGTNLWMYAANTAQCNQGAPGAGDTGILDSGVKVVANAIGPEGTITDGVCLKCHVAIDPTSLAAASNMKDAYNTTDGVPVTLNTLTVGGPIWAGDSHGHAYKDNLTDMGANKNPADYGTEPSGLGTGNPTSLIYLYR